MVVKTFFRCFLDYKYVSYSYIYNKKFKPLAPRFPCLTFGFRDISSSGSLGF